MLIAAGSPFYFPYRIPLVVTINIPEGVTMSRPKITTLQVSVRKVGDHPVLKSKAANARTIVFWLAALTVDEHLPGDHRSKLRATCVWCLASFFHTMDTCERILSAAEKGRLLGHGWSFLATYSALSREAIDAGDATWHLVPAHHYVAHLLLGVDATSTSPRFRHCFCDEDFVGRVAAVSRRGHRSTVAVTFMQRHMTMLHSWAGGI